MSFWHSRTICTSSSKTLRPSQSLPRHFPWLLFCHALYLSRGLNSVCRDNMPTMICAPRHHPSEPLFHTLRFCAPFIGCVCWSLTMVHLLWDLKASTVHLGGLLLSSCVSPSSLMRKKSQSEAHHGILRLMPIIPFGDLGLIHQCGQCPQKNSRATVTTGDVRWGRRRWDMWGVAMVAMATTAAVMTAAAAAHALPSSWRNCLGLRAWQAWGRFCAY
jgi:hypothetical protein